MKLTESMFREFVETDLTAVEVADLLTMVGFELEEISQAGDEPLLDINIMANRGDGASVLGLCREIMAKDASARPTALMQRLLSSTPRGDESIPLAVSVEIETLGCTRYSCRRFEGVSNGGSPPWVQSRLTQLGLRPISLLVDLTNLVMLETGQPLHAFDLDKMHSPHIIVREAREGERITTLDSQERQLRAGQVMICDERKPIAVGGVMGGLETEVDATTQRCLLESAHFDHRSVRRTRKQLGLQTDASYRFERYVDPAGAVRALNRFAELLEQCGGPPPVPGVVDVYPGPPEREAVKVRTARACLLLGTAVSDEEVERYLCAVGCDAVSTAGEFIVTPPTWRIDLEREDDLIEEVGRVHGYDKIPEQMPIGSTPVGGRHGIDAMVFSVREEALRCGMDQVISHSLRDTHALDRVGERVVVRNPHSPEIAHLRNSNLPCLADAFLRNGGKVCHTFEAGRVFDPDREFQQLALLCAGPISAEHWEGSDAVDAGFYSLKGVVESLLKRAGAPCGPCSPAEPDPRFHPTRVATVGDCAVYGQIHPLVAEECGLPADSVIAEIDLDRLYANRALSLSYSPVHRHPAARRDIAVVVPLGLAYREIETAVAEACGNVLERQWLFDVYSGAGIDPGHRSLAIGLRFRKDANFTDEEANQVRDAAVRALEGLGAKLR